LSDLVSQAKGAEKQNNLKLALTLYKKICKDYKTSEMASSAYYTRGLLYEKNHQFTSAIRMFTKIVKRYPESVWFMPAIEYYFRIARKLQRGVRPRYFGTIPGLRDYDSAVKNYELILQYAPYCRYAPEALVEIANLHIRAKHYDLAIATLDKLIDTYSNSVKVPYAYLEIGEIYSSLVKGADYNQGGAVMALRYYDEFCSSFPNHKEVLSVMNRMKDLREKIAQSKITLGDFYFNTRYNKKAAKILYRSAIEYVSYLLSAEVAKKKIEAIDSGAKPKPTPVDFLFPPYKLQSNDDNDEFVHAAIVEDRIMDQKEGRIDSTQEASVTPFVKSEDVHGAQETNCCEKA
jgi:outer membrane protein assembly factor BamD